MNIKNTMKKCLKMATLLVAGATLMVACGNSDGFKTTDDGLQYKFLKTNSDGQQVEEGDILVGEMTVTFDTIAEPLFSNKGNATRIVQASPSFDGGLYQGLLKMHVGDVAIFAVNADSLAKYVQPSQMPPQYQAGKGMKFYYEINLQDIVTKEEFDQERANYEEAMQQRQSEEPEIIANFIKENNIKVQPTAEGLYVIVKKRGNGPKVEIGKEIAVNYTGRLLDGTIFDSNVEADARTGGIYNPNRQYVPMAYVCGRDNMIQGWEQGVMGQPAGTILQLVIPSALGYGHRGSGNVILPFSPLTFDIEIVSVK
jgi:FKBP-type peptidyl-prolyl cis-trans isomerase